MDVIKPTSVIYKPTTQAVFLAGSIDMGNSEDWQSVAEQKLSNLKDLIVYNPRRAEWDSSWDQSTDNPNFVEQVNWELDAMDNSDIIFMYFAPDSKSPITLLELGLHASSGKLMVCCPKGYWRKGNVDIVCARHHIPQFTNLDDALVTLRSRI